MNDKKIMPFLIWLILKLRRSSWNSLKQVIDDEFDHASKMDVITADRQNDIQDKVIKRLK